MYFFFSRFSSHSSAHDTRERSRRGKRRVLKVLVQSLGGAQLLTRSRGIMGNLYKKLLLWSFSFSLPSTSHLPSCSSPDLAVFEPRVSLGIARSFTFHFSYNNNKSVCVSLNAGSTRCSVCVLFGAPWAKADGRIVWKKRNSLNWTDELVRCPLVFHTNPPELAISITSDDWQSFPRYTECPWVFRDRGKGELAPYCESGLRYYAKKGETYLTLFGISIQVERSLRSLLFLHRGVTKHSNYQLISYSLQIQKK